jgi:hypothetical protein
MSAGPAIADLLPCPPAQPSRTYCHVRRPSHRGAIAMSAAVALTAANQGSPAPPLQIGSQRGLLSITAAGSKNSATPSSDSHHRRSSWSCSESRIASPIKLIATTVITIISPTG